MSESLKVSEIFFSVQGEGACAGERMVFVRFVGCQLSCPWCDSAYASHPAEKDTMKTYSDPQVLASEVLSLLKQNVCERVCLTGGEPAVQDERLMKGLIDAFVDGNLDVHVETNGVDFREWMNGVQWITVSPKEADPEAFTRDYSRVDELKYVLEPGKVLPKFTGILSEYKSIMPMTKQPFADNLEFNMRSYNWAAETVMKTPGWGLTGRLQELAKVR